jgi:hypothetical protein
MSDKYRNNPIFKKYGYNLFSYIYSDVGYLDSQKIINLLELFRKSLDKTTSLKTAKSSRVSKRTKKVHF